MGPTLNKIKGISVTAALSFVGAGALYLTTSVDYTVFGPTAGLVAASIVGWSVKEYRPIVERYLNSL